MTSMPAPRVRWASMAVVLLALVGAVARAAEPTPDEGVAPAEDGL